MGKTKLGQHFLTDHRVVEKELSLAQLTRNDIVLEIGPGKGILTKQLANKCQHVIAVELDTRLIAFLQSTLPENVLLINKDIMDVSWNEIPSFSKVVANLPFQISSPFTFKLFSTSFEKAVLIYQKEFAQRMIAQPESKQYSRLSVGIAYKARCRIVTTIPPSSFSPPPEVSSSLVELIPYKTPPFNVIDEQFFFQITKLLFSHRRKQIKTILKNSFSKPIAKQVSFSSERVEMLTPQQIGELSNELFVYKSDFSSY
jgi:16S rRNA (adenine1518-N6/adenine1519-N6)-dimethyltransferase